MAVYNERVCGPLPETLGTSYSVSTSVLASVRQTESESGPSSQR